MKGLHRKRSTFKKYTSFFLLAAAFATTNLCFINCGTLKSFNRDDQGSQPGTPDPSDLPIAVIPPNNLGDTKATCKELAVKGSSTTTFSSQSIFDSNTGQVISIGSPITFTVTYWDMAFNQNQVSVPFTTNGDQIQFSMDTNLLSNSAAMFGKLDDGNSGSVEFVICRTPKAPVLKNIFISDKSLNPIIRIGGVKLGEEVSLFSDATCNTRIGYTQLNRPEDTWVDFPLHLDSYGSYKFYATSTSHPLCSSSYLGYNADFVTGIGFPLGNDNSRLGIVDDAVVDSAGNVYTIDTKHSQVVKFNSIGIATYRFGTFGTGLGEFNVPSALAIDSLDNVYVADVGRIQLIDKVGNISLVVTDITNSSGLVGLAIDSAGNIYVSDKTNNKVKVYTGYGSYLFSFGGFGSADGQFNSPHKLALDSLNNIYVTDQNNNRVQKFNSSGVFLSKFGTNGTGNGQFSMPGGILIHSTGNIFVSDQMNGNVQKFDLSGNYLTQFGTNGVKPGQFDFPCAIHETSDHKLVVADSHNHRLQVVDVNGNFVSELGSGGSQDGQFSHPSWITLGNSDKIFVSDSTNNRIQIFLPSGKYFSKFGTSGTGTGQFNDPEGIAADTTKNIYVVDSGNNRVQKFDSGGTFISAFGSAGSGGGQLNSPQGIAIDAAGNIFIVDSGNNRIQKFDSGGIYQSQFGTAGSGDGQFNSPKGIFVDLTGYIWISDLKNLRIQKFNSSGNFISKIDNTGSTAFTFAAPAGITGDSSGNIFVTDMETGHIFKFTSAGTYIQDYVAAPYNDGLVSPVGLVFDKLGQLYVSSYYSGAISKYSILGLPLFH